MVICGTLLMRNNYKEFILSCSHGQNDCDVEVNLERWQEFVLHIRNAHKLGFNDNMSCGSSTEFKTEAFTIDNNIDTETNNDEDDDGNKDCLAEAEFVDLPSVPSDEDDDSDSEYDNDDNEVGAIYSKLQGFNGPNH